MTEPVNISGLIASCAASLPDRPAIVDGERTITFKQLEAEVALLAAGWDMTRRAAGQWERALELSERAYEVSPEVMGRVLCQLWERIGAETGESPERSEAFTKVQSMFACSP